MKRHTSYRGNKIDMDMLKFQNQHKVALGNANMNARGDIIGNGGLVLKTREELLKEKEKEIPVQDVHPDQISSNISTSLNVPVFEDEDDKFTFNPNEEVVAEPEKVKPRKRPAQQEGAE